VSSFPHGNGVAVVTVFESGQGRSQKFILEGALFWGGGIPDPMDGRCKPPEQASWQKNRNLAQLFFC